MSTIQNSINTLIGTAGLAANLSSEDKSNKQKIKYGITGLGKELNEKIMYGSGEKKKSGLSLYSEEARMTARNKLKEHLNLMREEAVITDLAERKAKILGIFPTKKSREIREQGILRKEENIKSAIKDATAVGKALRKPREKNNTAEMSGEDKDEK